MINQRHLIALLFALVALTGYSQSGAVHNSLQPVIVKGSEGNAVSVNSLGEASTVMPGRQDAANSTATIASTGTLLAKRYVGSGKSSGGGTRDNNEFILKQNTAYLLRITEGNVANTNVNWEIDWYEHTNK